MQTPWETRFASRTQRLKSSAIRELLKLTEQPDIISFAGGLPAPEVFPIQEIAEAVSRVLSQKGSQALQYGPTEGYLPLREMIIQLSAGFGLQVSAENVLITSGSQQALDLLGKIFINRGDHIIVDSPTYLGALQAWSVYGAEYVPVAADENGMIISELEKALRTGPKFIYALPTFQNPSGTTLALERRLQLIELADRFGVPIIEDDPYGKLRFEGEHLPTLLALDHNLRGNSISYSGNVIYLSTFSKTLAPGLRLAWVTAPVEVIRKLVQAKQGADLHTATFNQMVGYEAGKNNFIEKHVDKIREVYRQRRNIMLDSLEELMPPTVHWTKPQGGLFLWVTLPEGMDSTHLFQYAVEEKVAYVPGASFYSCGGGENTMRLNFSYSKPELIVEGVTRLSRMLKRFI
jgi:2-aminoadipate transaminase